MKLLRVCTDLLLIFSNLILRKCRWTWWLALYIHSAIILSTSLHPLPWRSAGVWQTFLFAVLVGETTQSFPLWEGTMRHGPPGVHTIQKIQKKLCVTKAHVQRKRGGGGVKWRIDCQGTLERNRRSRELSKESLTVVWRERVQSSSSVFVSDNSLEEIFSFF